jgi:hypothetical protein
MKYVYLARRLGFSADYRFEIGTDAVESTSLLCETIAKGFRRSTVFAGKLTFHRVLFFHRLLRNETAFANQMRLQWNGITTVILPIRGRI